METKSYFQEIINKYLKKSNNKKTVNEYIQTLYDKYKYGYTEDNDEQLLIELQNYNASQDNPFLATGQSGYFHEQIMNNGLGNFKLNEQDREDAKFISNCFGKNTMYSENNIPITYTTLLGTTEFNYATQVFPAGIMEDVFQCKADHSLPIQPMVGEKEQDFYLRLLEHQIDSFQEFDRKQKHEVLTRGKRLIDNFCSHKNKIYLIKLKDILDKKASFGDVYGLRDGNASIKDAQQKINDLPSLQQLLETYHIDTNMLYTNPNMQSEYGIAIYDRIAPENIQFIEVERKYEIMQKKARELGYIIGDTIPELKDKESSTIDITIKQNSK